MDWPTDRLAEDLAALVPPVLSPYMSYSNPWLPLSFIPKEEEHDKSIF
jgi:hypothetical protein